MLILCQQRGNVKGVEKQKDLFKDFKGFLRVRWSGRAL